LPAEVIRFNLKRINVVLATKNPEFKVVTLGIHSRFEVDLGSLTFNFRYD
jgi:hypothetical protein